MLFRSRIALQIVARYAQTERERMKVMTAARRSLQLLNLALLTASREYSYSAPLRSISLVKEPLTNRRRSQQAIPFPDRRIVDRRVGAVSADNASASNASPLSIPVS